MKAKKPKESRVTMSEVVLPQHTNALGTIFGGTVMSWIDIAAAISAMRHARKTVVTASIDAIDFLAPIKLGHVVTIEAIVTYAGRTSMEVEVRVHSEDITKGSCVSNVTALATFVAVDENGKPVDVPPVKATTEKEKKIYEEGKSRQLKRRKRHIRQCRETALSES